MMREAMLAASLMAAAPAAAQGAPEVWMSRFDYPADAGGAEAIVRASVKFTPEGRVTDCLVAKPSRSAVLDQETCKLLRERGWFGATEQARRKGVETIAFRWKPGTGTPGPEASHASPISPERWVTNEDYPKPLVREAKTDTVNYRLEISEIGAVTGCTILTSSGSQGLDDYVCTLMRSRGRFFPAGDGVGGRATATWPSRMTFNNPEP